MPAFGTDATDDDLFVSDVKVVGNVEVRNFASRQACHGAAGLAQQMRMAAGTALGRLVMRAKPPYDVEPLHLVHERGFGQHGEYSVERHAVKAAVLELLQQFEVREGAVFVLKHGQHTDALFCGTDSSPFEPFCREFL